MSLSIPQKDPNKKAIMWSDYFRVFISVLLLIAYIFLFGSGFIKKYNKGGTIIVQDQVVTKAKNIPLPGKLDS